MGFRFNIVLCTANLPCFMCLYKHRNGVGLLWGYQIYEYKTTEGCLSKKPTAKNNEKQKLVVVVVFKF